VFYVLIQFKGLATAVHAVSGGVISGYAGASLAALIMLAYDLAGGMRSVAWTDCLQVWAGSIQSFLCLTDASLGMRHMGGRRC